MSHDVVADALNMIKNAKASEGKCENKQDFKSPD